MTNTTRLGELEQIAMLAVLRLGEDAYGAAIQEELAARADRRLSIATIYVTLTRLEAKGLVASSFVEGGGDRGGRAKRVFRLEPTGLRALREARQTLARMWDGLDAGEERAAHAG